MEVPVDEARGVVLRMGHRRDTSHVTVTGRIGASRAVVVERRASRFSVMAARRSAGR
jgi:hypothetical protein